MSRWQLGDGAGFPPPSIRLIIPLMKTSHFSPHSVYDGINSERLMHEQAILCARPAHVGTVGDAAA